MNTDVDDDPMDVDIPEDESKQDHPMMVVLCVGQEDEPGSFQVSTTKECIKYSPTLFDQYNDASFENNGSTTTNLYLPKLQPGDTSNVDKTVYLRVLDYLNFMQRHRFAKQWDILDECQVQAEEEYRYAFFADVDLPSLLLILRVANFLHIGMLMYACSIRFKQMYISNKTPEQIRQTLGIKKNGFTPQQQAAMDKEGGPYEVGTM